MALFLKIVIKADQPFMLSSQLKQESLLQSGSLGLLVDHIFIWVLLFVNVLALFTSTNFILFQK